MVITQAQTAPRSNRELWWSFFAILLITLVYLVVVYALKEVPAASSLFGHSIGILGFVMMLMTETLYSLRKRSRSIRLGRISSWLRFHIFTGIVGPYMVLLHSSWKFNGLAGIVMLMTVVIVISGFVGRYIYTMIPRTAEGLEVESNGRVSLDAYRRMMSLWHTIHIPIGMALFTAAFIHTAAAIYYATLLR
jgi:hypothetical protein